MITKIIAKGFKGWSGEQPLADRTLFVGPNGAGKTARSQALQLAVNGSVIGAGKTNDDILTTFGEGDKLVVGVEIEGTLFERGFVRSGDKVSQGYKVNGAKSSKEYFLKALGEAGAPVILNVADFMALSDDKKSEKLFNLYPPAGDVRSVQTKIDECKKKKNAAEASKETTETAAARIASSKTAIQVPAGTLAEVDAEIKEKESELAKARQELTNVMLEEQKAADELKAKANQEKREAEADLGKTRRAVLKEYGGDLPISDLAIGQLPDHAWQVHLETAKENNRPAPPVSDEAALDPLTTKPGPHEHAVIDRFGPETTNLIKTSGLAPVFPNVTGEKPGPPNQGMEPVGAVIDSITAIITALESAGCGACTARLVAKRELKKYQEVAS